VVVGGRDRSTDGATGTPVAGGRRLALLTSAFLAGFFVVFATGLALAQSPAKQPATSSALDVRELGPTARAQIEALIADKESRNAAQRKIDSRVLLAVDAGRPVPRRAILKSLARPQAGADGRIVVDIDLVDGRRAHEVVTAIRRVALGHRYVSPALWRRVLAGMSPSSNAPLTPREYDVLCLIALGFTVKEIAAQLDLGVSTVHTHRTRIMEKLKLRSDVELSHYALQNHLVEWRWR